ncbi:hypothetical protein GC177_10450 [bacterium]|nr:hypothetical protein [bacterium]
MGVRMFKSFHGAISGLALFGLASGAFAAELPPLPPVPLPSTSSAAPGKSNPFGALAKDDLLYKSSFGTADDVRAILERGMDPNIASPEGLTALHLAASRNDDEAIPIAELLVAKGANLEARDPKGNTPLHLAINSGRAKMVWWLLSKGADFYATDTSGLTPLQKAEREHQKDIAAMLQQAIDIDATRRKDAISPQERGRAIQNFAFYNCAQAYLNYYRQTVPEAKDEDGFKEEDFKKREQAILDYQNYITRNFGLPAIKLERMGKTTRETIRSQLDGFINNKERKRVGFGKQEDLQKRCTAISSQWKVEPRKEQQQFKGRR